MKQDLTSSRSAAAETDLSEHAFGNEHRSRFSLAGLMLALVPSVGMSDVKDATNIPLPKSELSNRPVDVTQGSAPAPYRDWDGEYRLPSEIGHERDLKIYKNSVLGQTGYTLTPPFSLKVCPDNFRSDGWPRTVLSVEQIGKSTLVEFGVSIESKAICRMVELSSAQTVNGQKIEPMQLNGIGLTLRWMGTREIIAVSQTTSSLNSIGGSVSVNFKFTNQSELKSFQTALNSGLVEMVPSYTYACGFTTWAKSNAEAELLLTTKIAEKLSQQQHTKGSPIDQSDFNQIVQDVLQSAEISFVGWDAEMMNLVDLSPSLIIDRFFERRELTPQKVNEIFNNPAQREALAEIIRPLVSTIGTLHNSTQDRESDNGTTDSKSHSQNETIGGSAGVGFGIPGVFSIDFGGDKNKTVTEGQVSTVLNEIRNKTGVQFSKVENTQRYEVTAVNAVFETAAFNTDRIKLHQTTSMGKGIGSMWVIDSPIPLNLTEPIMNRALLSELLTNPLYNTAEGRALAKEAFLKTLPPNPMQDRQVFDWFEKLESACGYGRDIQPVLAEFKQLVAGAEQGEVCLVAKDAEHRTLKERLADSIRIPKGIKTAILMELQECKERATVRYIDSEGLSRSQIYKAVADGDTATARALLCCGANPMELEAEVAGSQLPAIHGAARGSFDCFVLCYQFGGEIEGRDLITVPGNQAQIIRSNPLHHALQYAYIGNDWNYKTIEALIALGVDLNAVDSSGRTPLDYSTSGCRANSLDLSNKSVALMRMHGARYHKETNSVPELISDADLGKAVQRAIQERDAAVAVLAEEKRQAEIKEKERVIAEAAIEREKKLAEVSRIAKLMPKVAKAINDAEARGRLKGMLGRP